MLEIHSDSFTTESRTTVVQDGRIVGEMSVTGNWTADALVDGQGYHFTFTPADAETTDQLRPGAHVALWTGEPSVAVADARNQGGDRWEVSGGGGRTWGLRSSWRGSRFDVTVGDRAVGQLDLHDHSASSDLGADAVPVHAQYLLAYLVWRTGWRRTEQQGGIPT